jgi:adenine deaminase
MKVCGQMVDIHNRDIYPVMISISKGLIERIERTRTAEDIFIMPGLIDAHIHIESSMLTPGAFGLEAVKHGTTGIVADPHEIANVLGWSGVEYMIKDAKKSPVKFWFGAPSCVPATCFETSGATIGSMEIKKIIELPEIKYLSEMMNFRGVVADEKEVMAKIDAANRVGKPIDGHAPGLTGEKLIKYISAGITTDHECSSMGEALEKISYGMKILIREGSAAKNLNSLKDLFKTNPGMLMLCSDDLHPEMLSEGHINKLIAGLIAEGYNEFDVIRSATLNPVKHYKLEAGLLRQGQNADLIIVDSLQKMNVIETWINGTKVFNRGKVHFSYKPGKPVNNFRCLPVDESKIKVNNQQGRLRIIEAFDGELLTKEIQRSAVGNKIVETDIDNDVLKIVVKDRYIDAPPATGFIRGFGLKSGAFASSVAHDSHNIIAVGTNDSDIIQVINEIIRIKGGLAVSTAGRTSSLQLNIGGIMTTRTCEEVALEYGLLNELIKSLGCQMTAPLMTLSFMALLVIPSLKISDRGLFDVNKFQLVPLFADQTL